jgi:hypothetical protein
MSLTNCTKDIAPLLEAKFPIVPVGLPVRGLAAIAPEYKVHPAPDVFIAAGFADWLLAFQRRYVPVMGLPFRLKLNA